MIPNMKSVLFLLFILPMALQAAERSKNCGCGCCKGKDVCCCHADETKPAEQPTAKEVRHPLRGVIRDIYPERSAIMVRHEEIPGYMRAMTMMFKVDAATLAGAKKDQSITGTLVHRDGEFWLEDVKPAKP